MNRSRWWCAQLLSSSRHYWGRGSFWKRPLYREKIHASKWQSAKTCSLMSPAVYPLLRTNSPNHFSSICKQVNYTAYNLFLMVSILLCIQNTKGQFFNYHGANTMSNSLFFVILSTIAVIFNNNESVPILISPIDRKRLDYSEFYAI